MRKWMSIVLALTMLLALTACAPEVPPAADPQPVPPPEVEEGPMYWFEKSTTSDKFSDEEGNLLASYSYQIMEMQVSETADEQTVQTAEAFNAGMQEVLKSHLETGNELGQWASYDEYLEKTDGYYVEEVAADGTLMGCIYTVSFDYYNYMGGPHPNTSFYSRVFDLDRGAFVDPLEIADDPEQFRAIVTDLLLDEIRHLDPELQIGFFDGYESTVAEWNTRYVCFDEAGMKVIFSAYDLGPYAMGAQFFDISYDDLAEALGEGGQVKLGLRKSVDSSAAQ